jgi:hypothetical protein
VLPLAALTFLLWLVLGTDWFLGMRRVPHLRVRPLSETPDLPTLTVVVPALNEEGTIRAGLSSVLEQDYPGLEVVALNDRSTDRTGEILEALRARYPQLTVRHVTQLPEGWLGKNHALFVGAQEARGEWLLFTDADVRFAPGALRAAVALARERGFDHLVALPRMVARSPWLGSFVAAFTLLFEFYSGLWRVARPHSKSYLGIGAFNLIRRPVYEAVGGHRPIALRPDDDMMLGKLVKRSGFRQGVALAADLIAVEWYTSVREAVRGLRKNAFAGFGYSPPLLVLALAALLLTHVVPFGAVLVTTGLTQLLYAGVLFVVALVYVSHAHFARIPAWYAPLHPVGVLVLSYAALASMVTALRQGGITWRGTFYPLRQLKGNRV